MGRGNVATTATLAGFRREDISFHNARRQSEIASEVSTEPVEVTDVEVPVSTTPEQVIAYFRECIEVENDRDRRHLYSQTVKYIEKMKELEAKMVKYAAKEVMEKHKAELEEVEVDE